MNTRINPSLFLKSLEEEFRNKAKELNTLEILIKKLKSYLVPNKPEHYQHLGVTQAIRRYLLESPAPKSTKEITQELQSYGIYSKSHDLYNNINATLHRMNDVKKEDDGWVLKGE